jgi:16S rRNA (adenine1518-N6/adenine1519-N6)-dimethyltransferase
MMDPRPIKSLGQHFLVHEEIAERMVSEAGITDRDSVWEIGPGKGILTRQLLKTGCSLRAYELDRRMCQILQSEMDTPFELINQDILKINWDSEIAKTFEPIKLVANIPYNITSPLLYMLEKHHQSFSMIVLMIQKEVAQRICAEPGTKAYGVMTLRLKRIFDTGVLFIVTKDHFDPPPEVDSAVICLETRKIQPKISDVKKYLHLITLAFAHRRKTLRNNLSSLMDKQRMVEIQNITGIDLNRRGETLSEAEFITLCDSI